MPKGYFTRRRTPLMERIWKFISPEPFSGCWLWLGTTTGGKPGYGYIGAGGHDGPGLRAHIVLWEHKNGPVPDGLELDHLCRVRECVNPDHLEAVTHQVNCQRGNQGAATKATNASRKGANKTHLPAPKGHPYDRAKGTPTRPPGEPGGGE